MLVFVVFRAEFFVASIGTSGTAVLWTELLVWSKFIIFKGGLSSYTRQSDFSQHFTVENMENLESVKYTA